MREKPAVKLFVDVIRFYGLLGRYIYLQLYYLYLVICRFLLKAAGAALIEAVKMEYCIKSLSREDRVIFATCIAVAIYMSALVMFIRT